MTSVPRLLPADFEARLDAAVSQFWQTRSKSPKPTGQGGGRDAVVSGKNMQGFADLVIHVASHCGIPAEAVHTRKSKVILPGFFRATKNWDVLVVHQGRLLAVFEFKSQVGSFGNNFNNRSEEVIGSAADLWVAHHHRAYSEGPHRYRQWVKENHPALLNPAILNDPRPPFVGWLMLLEDCAAACTPVSVEEPHFSVFDEFRGASYAQRYHILCERLVERQLYAAAALELSDSVTHGRRSLSPATSLRNLFSEFAGRMLAASER